MNPSSSSQVTARTVWTVALHVLAIAALLAVVKSTASVVAWVLIAAFLALALEPAVRWLHRRRGMKRALAVLLVFAAAAGVLTVLVATLVPMLVDQARSLVASAPDMLIRFEESRVGAWAARFELVERARAELGQLGPDAAKPMLGVLANLFEGILGAVTITVLTIFMLLFGGQVFTQALAWLAPVRRERARALTERMRKTVGGYVAGSLLIALIGGVVTAVGTLLLGVPYFLPLGLLMAILGVIPFLGSALGAVLVVGTTFAAAGTKAGVIALVGYLVYQQVENHLLQPLIQRKTIQMNPLVITLVMLFGTALFGVLGALLALPTAGALQVVLQDRLARRQARWGEQQAPEAPAEPDAPARGLPGGGLPAT